MLSKTIAKWFRAMPLAAIATSALLLWPSTSRAGFSLTVEAPGVQSSQLAGGVTTETFDARATTSYTLINSVIGTYTAPSPGLIVVSPNAYGGANQTRYMSVGAQSGQTSAILTFNTPQDYFGIYWGAIDARNSLGVYDGATLVMTVNQASLSPLLLTSGGPNGHGHYGNPNNGQNLSEAFVYVNIFGTAGSKFTSIHFNNDGTGTGFESDNHSIRAVPEPSSLVALSIGGFGLLGAAARRRMNGRRQSDLS